MKLVILDRDGVINYDSAHYIKSPDEWLAIPGSLAAIAKLNCLGYKVAIATNQSGIARGLYSEETLTNIHQKMQAELAQEKGYIDFIAYCPHHPNDHCNCRKPKIGMFESIQNFFACEFQKVFFVGDNKSDLQAAKTANYQPILVATGNGASVWQSLPKEEQSGIPIYKNLQQFVDTLC